MRKTNRVQLLVALVLLIGGVAGYFAVIPQQYVNLNSLSRLLVATPGFPGVPKAPTLRLAAPVDSASPASLRQGNDLNPGQTGSYSADFLNSPTAGTGVTTNVELLPTKALANLAYTEQNNGSLAASVVKAERATHTTRFSLPGVSKGEAVAYDVPNTKKSIAVVTGLIQFGRAVVLVNIEGPSATKAHLTSIMEREAKLLEANVPAWPSMWATRYPLGGSLLWFGVVLVLIALVFAVPASMRAANAARIAREEARRRYELRSRGAKVVRRKRVARR